MILIVSPNLCLDRVIVVRGIRAGGVHRAESAAVSAGGKGLNVARVVRALGEVPRVAGIVGDDAPGRALEREARAQGLGLHTVRVSGGTRTCTLLVDPGRGETVINEPGPRVPRDAMARLRALAHEAAPRAKVIVVTGSLPPGVPEAFYATVARSAGSTSQVILDASGGELRTGLAARPYLVKVNSDELAGLVGGRLRSLRAVGRAAIAVRDAGAGAVLVTLGERGALLTTSAGLWRLTPPRVRRVNAIGAGDSLTAGIAVGLARRWSLSDAIRLGMAAAAVDVTTLLPGTVDRARVAHLVTRVRVRPWASQRTHGAGRRLRVT